MYAADFALELRFRSSSRTCSCPLFCANSLRFFRTPPLHPRPFSLSQSYKNHSCGNDRINIPSADAKSHAVPPDPFSRRLFSTVDNFSAPEPHFRWIIFYANLMERLVVRVFFFILNHKGASWRSFSACVSLNFLRAGRIFSQSLRFLYLLISIFVAWNSVVAWFE